MAKKTATTKTQKTSPVVQEPQAPTQEPTSGPARQYGVILVWVGRKRPTKAYRTKYDRLFPTEIEALMYKAAMEKAHPTFVLECQGAPDPTPTTPPAIPQAETPAPLDPEAPQTDTPPPGALEAPQDTRVAYLIDLVSQGREAVAKAIRSGKVQVRLPKAAAAKAKPKEQAGGLSAILAKGNGPVPLSEDDIARITGLFQLQPNGTCVFWTGRTEKSGRPYGKTTVAGRIYLVHRLAWQMYHGEYPGTEIAIKQRCGFANCVSEQCLYRPDQEPVAQTTGK
jgi:hypothetical protein